MVRTTLRAARLLGASAASVRAAPTCRTKPAAVRLGEFGRTPKINALAGRDHWPQTAQVLFAGVRGGQVIGQTDKQGGELVGPVLVVTAPVEGVPASGRR